MTTIIVLSKVAEMWNVAGSLTASQTHQPQPVVEIPQPVPQTSSGKLTTFSALSTIESDYVITCLYRYINYDLRKLIFSCKRLTTYEPLSVAIGRGVSPGRRDKNTKKTNKG